MNERRIHSFDADIRAFLIYMVSHCLGVRSGIDTKVACLFDNARVLLRNSLIKFDLTKHQ